MSLSHQELPWVEPELLQWQPKNLLQNISHLIQLYEVCMYIHVLVPKGDGQET